MNQNITKGLLVATILFVALTSCSQKSVSKMANESSTIPSVEVESSGQEEFPDNPSAALYSYIRAVQDNNYKAFYEGLNPCKDNLRTGGDTDEGAFYERFVAVNQREFGKRGGIERFEILSTEYSNNGESAVVEYNMYYGNGEIDHSTQKMIKVKGRWYMN